MKNKILTVFEKEFVMTENSNKAKNLYDKCRYGTIFAEGKIQLSLLEATYLLETGKIIIYDKLDKEIILEALLKKATKKDKNFLTKYIVFKDLRKKGYIVKTALKFGADFRVYEKGVKPGEDHAKWVVFPVHERNTHTWQEFTSKNRVAHSTKKRLMIPIIDDESDVTYYEVKWIKP